MKGLSFKWILLGLVVDLFSSLFVGTVFAIFFGVSMARNMATQGTTGPEQLAAMFTSPGFLIGSLVIGLVCSVLGGFIGAGPEPQHALTNATVLGVVLAFLSYAMSGSQFPQWYRVATPLLTLTAVILSGYFKSLRKPTGSATTDTNLPPIPLP